jgi:hypothetical protein
MRPITRRNERAASPIGASQRQAVAASSAPVVASPRHRSTAPRRVTAISRRHPPSPHAWGAYTCTSAVARLDQQGLVLGGPREPRQRVGQIRKLRSDAGWLTGVDGLELFADAPRELPSAPRPSHSRNRPPAVRPPELPRAPERREEMLDTSRIHFRTLWGAQISSLKWVRSQAAVGGAWAIGRPVPL